MTTLRRRPIHATASTHRRTRGYPKRRGCRTSDPLILMALVESGWTQTWTA